VLFVLFATFHSVKEPKLAARGDCIKFRVASNSVRRGAQAPLARR